MLFLRSESEEVVELTTLFLHVEAQQLGAKGRFGPEERRKKALDDATQVCSRPYESTARKGLAALEVKHVTSLMSPQPFEAQ